MNKKKLLKYETNKLFYNKYLYCLSSVNSLASIFRNKNFKFACTVLDQMQYDFEEKIFPLQRKHGNFSRQIPNSHFFDAKTIYNELTRYKDPYLVRCEGNTISFYTNDDIFLNRLKTKLRHAYSYYSPAKEHLAFISNNTNTIIVKDDTYKFKVTFNSNLVPESLGPWLKANRDKVKFSDMLLNDLYSNMRYLNGRYIWINTEKVLMLFKILAGNCIQRIDKLVCAKDIDK